MCASIIHKNLLSIMLKNKYNSNFVTYIFFCFYVFGLFTTSHYLGRYKQRFYSVNHKYGMKIQFTKTRLPFYLGKKENKESYWAFLFTTSVIKFQSIFNVIILFTVQWREYFSTQLTYQQIYMVYLSIKLYINNFPCNFNGVYFSWNA